MTNAEKFKKVFGFEHDNHCPYKECKDPEGDDYEACEDCLNDFWECEYRGEPTKTDLISKDEALELFPLILSGELLSIGTVREQLRELQTVKAVPLSVIEKIHDAVDNADFDARLEDENGSYTEEVFTREHIHEIISKVVKECTHE